MVDMRHLERNRKMVVAGWTGLFGAAAFLLVNVGLPRMGCGCMDVRRHLPTPQAQVADEDHDAAADQVEEYDGE
jgi:hypothetical protein